MDSCERANVESIRISIDPLNVMTFEIPPLPSKLLETVKLGRSQRTQVLDGSALDPHDELRPYAETHVSMSFKDEADIIRCVRLLQWSDERMRARENPYMLWAWREAFRLGEQVEFSVVWYTKEFFEERKDSFSDDAHVGYLSRFNMTPSELKIRHEVS
tara:strand:- start:339 stop:815 length:477 start_codon:yes stop_codon:yes gene_type:complete